jgi:predicted double-glycine peptidase
LPGVVGSVGSVGQGRLHRAVIGIAAAAALVSATTGAWAIRASRTPRLVPVPLISQSQPWTCGAAALMATLVYFGVFDDAESSLVAELGTTPVDGTHVRDIVSVARRFGLTAEARTRLTLADLEAQLAGGAVVIAALQAWPSRRVSDWRSDWDDGHYVVIVGVSRRRVYVMDPSVRTGYAYLTRDEFLRRWHDYDVEDDRVVVWDRLGIVIRGGPGLARYPADPAPVQ